MTPDPFRDLCRFVGLLSDHVPFRFVRFSDGEMEIIRNQRLEITATHLNWRKGSIPHKLPPYDVKRFDPATDEGFREDLLGTAHYRAVRFFKGLPTSHNNAVIDRDLLIEMNGGFDSYLTFADLLINSNYRMFMNVLFPVIRERSDVFIVGNHRMKPELARETWKLLPVPDNFFADYGRVKRNLVEDLVNLPSGALVLSSASSLSNVLGHVVDVRRRDLTFLDIGTALHGSLGLDPATRDYHVEGQPWTLRNATEKLRYRRSSHYRIRW